MATAASSVSPGGKRFFGLAPNVIWLGVVSLLNDLSSDMIFPFIPIFLTSVLGASLTFVGLVEGIADATASILKIWSGWLSDRWGRRKSFAVFGYALSAVAKPVLAAATLPWHVLGVRFMDRVGKGARDAPRDALISFSAERSTLGRAFGFHRAMDTLGAALGPLAAFAILPFIDENYRTLFLLSFVASFFAVLILAFFVREVRSDGSPAPGEEQPGVAAPEAAAPRQVVADILPRISPEEPPVNQGNKEAMQHGGTTAGRSGRLALLGAPFFIFLGVATLASLGKASEAFLILQAREVGVALRFLPLLYFSSSITFALLATPLGVVADRVGKRNTFTVGLAVFALAYAGFAFTTSPRFFWALFAVYGLYAALTEGVGRAIVAGFVPPAARATAFGIYNAATGFALLPASIIFGYLAQHFGSRVAFSYGAGLAIIAALLFIVMRRIFAHGVNLTAAS